MSGKELGENVALQEEKIKVYDTTLRDGAQGVGIDLSVAGRLLVARRIAEGLPITGIEGGWPGANPTHTEFFKRAVDEPFHDKLYAFGMTRRAGTTVESDQNIKNLIESQAPGITFVGKSSREQVEKTMHNVTPEENLNMIRESIKYATEQSHVKSVIYDAEHFFDGFKGDGKYAIETLYAAAEGGADVVVLCDTNGRALHREIHEVTKIIANDAVLHQKYREAHGIEDPTAKMEVGIHAHKDRSSAEANSLEAVYAGAKHVQVTVNGFGERVGNTDAIPMLLNLQTAGFIKLSEEMQAGFTDLSRTVFDAAGVHPNPNQPVTGDNAGRSASGMHTAATARNRLAYAWMDLEKVGNKISVSVDENSGRAGIKMKMQEMGLPEVSNEEAALITEIVKEKSAQGYRYAEADASFYLLARKLSDPSYQSPFEEPEFVLSEKVEYTNTFFNQVKKQLTEKYSQVANIRMIGEKDQTENGSIKRVFVTASDGKQTWTTVGVGATFDAARLEATKESFEFALCLRISEGTHQ